MLNKVKTRPVVLMQGLMLEPQRERGLINSLNGAAAGFEPANPYSQEIDALFIVNFFAVTNSSNNY